MFSSCGSSNLLSTQSVRQKVSETASATATSEQYFCSSFSEARGDRVLGLSSITSKENSTWTPVRLLESLRVAFNIMAEQPEAYNFESLPGTEVNDKPTTIIDVEDALAVVVTAEKQRKKPSRDNNSVGNNNAKDGKVALSDVTPSVPVDCVIDFVTGFFDCIVELEERAQESGSINNAFSDIPDSTSNKLDKLFSDLCKHPGYAHAYGLLDAEEGRETFTRGEAWQRIHKSATYLFSNISKRMIDEFIQQKSEGVSTACLHVLLDDIQMVDVVDNKELEANGITAEELRHLYRCRAQLGDTVRFYKNNMPEPSPWEQDPELWARYVPAKETAPPGVASSGTTLNASAMSTFEVPSVLEKSRVVLREDPNGQMQKPAYPDQIFDLRKNDKNEYEFVRQDNGERYDLEGVLAFVILAEEPDHIICGSRNYERSSNGKLNNHRYKDPFFVDGHSSLSGGKPTLFAGEILFEEGKIKFWTNGSGHYKPHAEHRFSNLTDLTKRLLPEDCFRDHDKLTGTEIQALERHKIIPKELEDVSDDGDDSLSEDDENAAFIAQRKKTGLRGGGAADRKTSEGVCAPVSNAMEKKPRDDDSDNGGAGAGAFSAPHRTDILSDSDSEDDAKPDRPSGSANAMTPPTAPVSKSLDTVGPASVELQHKLTMALNSGEEIKAVQIERMLEFAILLAKSSPVVQASVIDFNLFKRADELFRIPVSYFNGRLLGSKASWVPGQIAKSLMQSLNNCVSNGALSEERARGFLARKFPGFERPQAGSVNIFADPRRQDQAVHEISLLIGTREQRQERIAADNRRIADEANEVARKKLERKQHDAELAKFSVRAGAQAYQTSLNKRDREENERQDMLSRGQAEKQANYLNARAVRGREWTNVLAGIGRSQTYQAHLSNERRKQEQENSQRSVQRSLPETHVDKPLERTSSTDSSDSGYSSSSSLSRSFSSGPITSADISQEILDLRSEYIPELSDIDLVQVEKTHMDIPEARSTVGAEEAFRLYEDSVNRFLSLGPKIEDFEAELAKHRVDD